MQKKTETLSTNVQIRSFVQRPRNSIHTESVASPELYPPAQS